MNYPILLYRGEKFNSNFYYLAKFDIDHAFLLVNDSHKTLFVPKLNEALARELFDGKVIVYENALEELKKKIKSKIYVDGSSLSMRLFEKLSAFCKPKDISENLSAMRAVKSSDEVKKIAKAAKITKEIFDSIDFSKMRTENDVKKFLLMQTLERDVQPAFEPIVATDSNSSFPHYKSGNVKLGDLLLIDYAVKYQHYCADVTRCFFFSRSKENNNREDIYESLIEITKKIVNKLGKIKQGKEIGNYAETLLKEYKLPKMIHSIGHGVGLDVHESPSLGKKSKDKITKSALAIEPAVYFKDYGLRYEETIYFDGAKAKVL